MIISSFPPIVGGGERQAQQLAACLVEQGVDVCVITRRYQALPNFEHVDGVPVYRIPMLGYGPLAALTFILGSIVLMARFNRHCSILHCHQASLGIAPATIAVLAKRRWGGKIIVKFMGSRVCDMAQSHTWVIRRWLLRQADAFVAMNDPVRMGLKEIGLDVPTCLLPNGVDTRTFCPTDASTRQALRQRLGLPLQSSIMLFVGRLDPVKALDALLQAWARVVQQMSERQPTLVLVGNGSERDRLVQLAQELGISASVHFAGASDKVAEWYNSANLFVLPSHIEGLSNALLEAMACGLPVIATAVGGTPEVIENNVNGLLVPPKDVDALSEAILHLIRHPAQAQRFGQAARQTVQDHYSIDAVVDRYVKLYSSLLGSEKEA
jgi:glycosyltransferase involved in cell wall biosynthesis